VSISTVGTWRTVNIWTENGTEVSNGFLSLPQIPLIKQMKTQVLNLKKKVYNSCTNRLKKKKLSVKFKEKLEGKVEPWRAVMPILKKWGQASKPAWF